jgi:hypothetical protein
MSKQFAVGWRFTDDWLWRRRRVLPPWSELAEMEGVKGNSLTQAISRRGWKRTKGSHDSAVTHAPCAVCDKSTMVERLNPRRECYDCRPPLYLTARAA